jgi:hypothetical protein
MITAPSGQKAVVVTMFIPTEGAAPGEAGELIYYSEFSPEGRTPSPAPEFIWKSRADPMIGDRETNNYSVVNDQRVGEPAKSC